MKAKLSAKHAASKRFSHQAQTKARMEKDISCNGNDKRVAVANTTSDKIDFKTRPLKKKTQKGII